MTNWQTEYKVDFHIMSITDGVKDVEYNSLIIEATSPINVQKLINAQFGNVVGFSIDKITKIWEY